MKRRVRVKKTRDVKTYANLWSAAQFHMRRAKDPGARTGYYLISGMVFTAFAVEAYFNHLGAQHFACWSAIERPLSPVRKLRLLAEKLGFKIDEGKTPFQSVFRLLAFRDGIAHGKSDFLESEEKEIVRDIDMDPPDEPLATFWEQFCTVGNAERVHSDAETVIRRLNEASGGDDHDLFIAGFELRHESLVPETENTQHAVCVAGTTGQEGTCRRRADDTEG